MAKYNSRRSGVRAGSKPALAPEPQDCHGALVGLPPHERNGMGHGRPQDMMTMGEGPQQIPPATHSPKRQKMYNRCVRERDGNETAGWLHFRESLAKKRKEKRGKRKGRDRGGTKEDQGNKEQVHETKRMETNKEKEALQAPVPAPVASPPIGGGVPLETAKGVMDPNGDVLLNVTIRPFIDGDGTVSVLEPKLYCGGWWTDCIGWVQVPLETTKGTLDTNVTIKLTQAGDGKVSLLQAKLHCVCVGWQTDCIGWVQFTEAGFHGAIRLALDATIGVSVLGAKLYCVRWWTNSIGCRLRRQENSIKAIRHILQMQETVNGCSICLMSRRQQQQQQPRKKKKPRKQQQWEPREQQQPREQRRQQHPKRQREHQPRQPQRQ